MDHKHDIELIEKLLQNQLPENERQELEQRIRQDEVLTHELERRQKAHHALDFVIAQNLKEQLQNLEEESKVVSLRSRRRTLTYVLSAAASVLLIVGTFSIIYPGGAQPAELASSYYELPDFSNRRSVETPEGTAARLDSGVEALKNQNYDQAISQLADIPDQDEYYIPANYYLGHAYYLSSQFKLAEKSFKVVISANDIRYQEESEWYALLSCLQLAGDCNTSLDRISENTAHLYHEKALKIQQRLK